MFSQESFPIDDCPPIDLSKQYELRYWADRLQVGPDELRAAVALVGTHPRDVEHHFAMVKFAYLTPAFPESHALV